MGNSRTNTIAIQRSQANPDQNDPDLKALQRLFQDTLADEEHHKIEEGGMKWYFLNIPDANPDEINQFFRGQGIAYSVKVVHSPLPARGVCFPDSQLSKVKKLLGIQKVGRLDKKATDLRNVFFITFNGPTFTEEAGNENLREWLFGKNFMMSGYLSGMDKKKAGYIEACKERIEGDAKKIQQEAAKAEKAIEELSKKLTQACRQHADLMDEAGTQKSGQMAVLKMLEKEYDQINADKNVESVEITKDCVIIRTGMLTLSRVKIGKFELKMFFNHPTDRCFQIKNTTNAINNVHHPHINDPNNPCFGPTKTEIRKAIKARRFYLAFCLVWRKLNVFTDGDAYAQPSAFSRDEADRRRREVERNNRYGRY
ncbi:hypothetical protein ACFL2D_02350 [Patescibacteria group bacterium]